MKKSTFLILTLALVCLVLPAFSESGEYTIDAADQITVGLGETIHLPFQRPYSSLYRFNAYCSDPEALQLWQEVRPESTYTDTTLPVTGTFDVCFQKKGTFDLHITFQERIIRTIRVTVDDLATKASVAQERFVLRAGETVNTGLTLENGAMYNLPTFTKGAYYDNFVQISEDGLTLKGVSKGHMTVYVINPLKQELCQFEVVVVEECENVGLSCPQEYAVVGRNLTLSAKSNGEEAFPLVTITEGSDCVRWDGDSRVWSFYPFAPGWVTFTAYGTDGSTSSVRIRVLSGADDIVYDIPKTTLAAGETVEVSVLFPGDARCTITMDQPAEQGLEGTVALVNGNRLTAVTAGTCNLVLHAAGARKVIPITVTDSPRALTVVRPRPYMDVESSFRLSVQDQLGNVYPAVFSQDGSNFTIEENGLITPSRAASSTLRATLENGAEFSFEVRPVRFPKELTCTAEEIVLALDNQSQALNSNGTIGNIIYDELGAVSSNDLVVCSDDPSIVETELEGKRLYPRKVGNTTITVWSRYCDLSVRVPVRIVEPAGIYVDGRDFASMNIPKGKTLKLPTVTDYYGNPVKVTWKITECSMLPGSTSMKAFQLMNNGTSLKALSDSGYAYVTATSQTGATLRCTADAYKRSESFTLSMEQVQLNTGSWEQIEIRKKDWTETEQGDGSMLYPDDLTYSLSGDADCIQLESFGPGGFRFSGLKPGTVTMTVTLYNGFSASAEIRVTLPDSCQNGHDPVWKTEKESSLLFGGTEALRCSRCGVTLGETRKTPATGVIAFGQKEFYLTAGEEIELLTQLNGNRHYSFVWESSDPSVASVTADRVTALQPGAVTITAAFYGGDCAPAVCRVRVVPKGAGMKVSLPEGLRRIEDEAFAGAGIGSAVIPEGVQSIGSRAFAGCAELTYVCIPASVTSIAPDAFDGSPQVIFLCPDGSAAADYALAHGIPAEQ